MLRCLRTLFIFALILCCSCADYTKQESEGNEHQPSPEARLATFGLSLAEKNAQGFYLATQNLNKILESESNSSNRLSDVTRSTLLKSYETLLQQLYWMQGFAVGHIKTVDGQSPLSSIYYRTLNRCLVDTFVLETKNKQPLSALSLHPSVASLAAIEYLLFDKKLVSNCNLKAHPQMEGWNQLPDAEKQKDRLAHALLLLQKISEAAAKIAKDWTPQSSTYESNLKVLEYTKSEDLALKNMIQALSALEKVKDFDLGKPLGQNSLCTSDAGKCPEDVQHIDSQLSLAALIASLQGFERFFNGVQPQDYSVKNYLEAKNQKALAVKINTLLRQALETAATLNRENTLLQLVENMNPSLCQKTTLSLPAEPICYLFKQVESITDIYKSDLLTFVSLEIDHSIPQGDND